MKIIQSPTVFNERQSKRIKYQQIHLDSATIKSEQPHPHVKREEFDNLFLQENKSIFQQTLFNMIFLDSNEVENSQTITPKNLEKDEFNVKCEQSMEIELSFVHQDTILNSGDGNDYPEKLNIVDDKNSSNDPEKIELEYTKIRVLNTKTEPNKIFDKSITEIDVKFEEYILNHSFDDKYLRNNINLTLNTSCNVKSQAGIINN